MDTYYCVCLGRTELIGLQIMLLYMSDRAECGSAESTGQCRIMFWRGMRV